MYQARAAQNRCRDDRPAPCTRRSHSIHRPGVRPRRPCAGILAMLLIVNTLSATTAAAEKKIIGWIERVSLAAEGLILEAKIDTGADFSSVHAEEIRYFTRDGRRWVEFALRDRNNASHILQRRLERMARIKKKTEGFQERPVVTLQVCVGDTRHPAQVNLAQRGHFKYPLLLGRSFLDSHFLVDPSTMYLQEPACPTSAVPD